MYFEIVVDLCDVRRVLLAQKIQSLVRDVPPREKNILSASKELLNVESCENRSDKKSDTEINKFKNIIDEIKTLPETK